MKRITILGDGSWGTACATICAYNGIHTTLWCYNASVAESIAHQHENRTYLPDITLDTEYIHPTTSLEEAVTHADNVCFAVPVKHLRSVLRSCAPYMHAGQKWVSLSKGIEQDTLLFPTQVALDVAPVSITPAVIAGPSFAREVAQHKLTGMMCASHMYKDIEPLVHAFTTPYTSIDVSYDMTGTQIAGALKNTYAIASGILDASTNSHNAAALLISHALAEMQSIAGAMHADPDTLLTRAGIGDLVLTCQGSQSRNRKVGHAVGTGKALNTYLEEVDFVPEGVNTSKAVMPYLRKQQLHTPIIEAVYAILHEGASVDRLTTAIMWHR